MPRPFAAVFVCSLLAASLLAARALVPAQTEGPGTPAIAKPMTGPELFADKGCVHCHGENLEGTERGPDLRGVGRRLKAEQIEKQIHDGGQSMPPFGEILEPTEIKTLAAYLGRMKAKKPKAASPR